VVGRLAARHGVIVELVHGESSGTVATVRLPTGAVVPGADELVEEFASAMAASTPLQPIDPPAMEEMPSAETIAEQPARVPTTGATPIPADPAPFADPAVNHAVPRGLDAIPRTVDPTPAPVAVAPALSESAPLDPAPLSPPVTPPVNITATTPRPDDRAQPLADLAAALDPVPHRAPAAPPVQREQLLADLAVAPTSAAPMSASVPVGLAAPTAPRRPAAARNEELASAQTSATEAVGAVLSVFSADRRTPGANLPNTSLVNTLSGVMSLDSPSPSPTPTPTPAPAPAPTAPATAPSPPGHDADPDKVRFQLAGFQSGTRRADQED